MAQTHFRLQTNFIPRDVKCWYNVAAVGDVAVITIPSRLSPLRLLCVRNNCVHWWPEGGRGVTIPLDEAVQRLEMLSNAHYAVAWKCKKEEAPSHY